MLHAERIFSYPIKTENSSHVEKAELFTCFQIRTFLGSMLKVNLFSLKRFIFIFLVKFIKKIHVSFHPNT